MFIESAYSVFFSVFYVLPSGVINDDDDDDDDDDDYPLIISSRSLALASFYMYTALLEICSQVVIPVMKICNI